MAVARVIVAAGPAVFNRTETVLDVKFATARSSMPSPL